MEPQETIMNTIRSSRETIIPPISARRSNRIVRWSGRTLLGLLALVGGLAAIGAIYQAIATAHDRRAYPPPGQLIDVGGYRIHLASSGANNGNPTVILLACGGCTSAN